jgi:drug/metabolite transporter (DMT)-like permease
MKTASPLARRDVILLLLLNVLWGSTYVVARDVMETAPPLVLAVARYAVASVCMLLMAAARSRRPSTDQRPTLRTRRRHHDLLLIALIGVVGFGVAKVLSYEGLVRSTATDAALIINLEAVFTALLAAAWLGQRLAAAQWSGITLALAGGVLLVWPADPGAPGHGRAFGNALMIGSVAAEALASVLGARVIARFNALEVTAYGTYWGTACLLPFALWQWRESGFSTAWITWGNAGAVVYLALGATVLAYALWFQLLGRVEAGRAAAFLYVQPVVGVALGLLVRGEWPTWLGAAGGALVLAGIGLATRPGSNSNSSSTSNSNGSAVGERP